MKNLCGKITQSGKSCKKYRNKNCETCWVHGSKQECSICFEIIREKYKLKCGHSYCRGCISKWVYLLNKQTCPLCRKVVEYREDYDSLEYCLDNLMITKDVVNEFVVTDDELIDYIKLIIHEDGHYYDATNWTLILNYIRTSPDMYIKWAGIQSYVYNRYIEYDPENPGVLVDGRSYTYTYRFLFNEI